MSHRRDSFRNPHDCELYRYEGRHIFGADGTCNECGLPEPKHITPGARYELNERSGNPGRKGFVLIVNPIDRYEVLVRADGFAYNSITPNHWITVLPDEPFRPMD